MTGILMLMVWLRGDHSGFETDVEGLAPIEPT